MKLPMTSTNSMCSEYGERGAKYAPLQRDGPGSRESCCGAKVPSLDDMVHSSVHFSKYQ